jgi:hypothetical protein
MTLIWVVAAAREQAAAGADFVRGLAGQPRGGFRQNWYTHLGEVPLLGIRQQWEDREMEWKTAPLPSSLTGETVTFAWSGAMGLQTAGGGGFTLSVNGREVADFDVVLESTQFPCRSEKCRFLYRVLFTYPAIGTPRPLDSSGHFFLTVPRAWLKAGEPALLRVKGGEAGSPAWFAVIQKDDAPLAVPNIVWADFRQVERAAPAAPSRRGEEASYEGYLKLYGDPGIFTPIGPPSDPAETAVSPHGQLMYANDRCLSGTPLVANALAFALEDQGRIVPLGTGKPAQQSLMDGYLPIVITNWQYGSLELRETAFARPLRGADYTTGLESTLAWAVFELTNRAATPRPVAFLAALLGDEKHPKRDLRLDSGVVFENQSARFSWKVPPGLRCEFRPVWPANIQASQDKPTSLLRKGGLYNTVAIRGEVPAGQTVRLVFNRVFDFPGAGYWPASPPRVQPDELLRRTADTDLEAARTAWKARAATVSRFVTPDAVLNRIVDKGMLDGYFLTKRWNGQWIVFDSVCYRCQWDDASTKWFYALDLLGDHATAAKLLDTVFARQGKRKPAGTRTREGCFSDVTNTLRDGSDASWASCNGWALWAMTQHARLSNNRTWLAEHKQQILDGCAWIIRERQASREKPDNPCAGLIYGRFVCDSGEIGYFPYTDAVSYMGLSQTATLLAEWGHPQGRELLAEAEAYRKDIVAAIDRLTDKSRDPWYVPWALHAPKREDVYLNGACGPINLAFGGVLPRDDPRIRHIIRWNIDHTNHGSLEASATASMFYSQDLACVLLEQGRVEDFLRMFYAILAADVSHQTLTTCEWRSNTQPHVHSVSSLVRMFRTMMIQERDGGLYLLQGTPRRWLDQGKEILITEAPTWYGPLSLACTSAVHDGKLRIRLDLPPRLASAPIHLRLRLPDRREIREVLVNGRVWKEVRGDWIVLRDLRGHADVDVNVALAARREAPVRQPPAQR